MRMKTTSIEWDGDTLYRRTQDGKRKMVGHIAETPQKWWDVYLGKYNRLAHTNTEKEGARRTLENYA